MGREARIEIKSILTCPGKKRLSASPRSIDCLLFKYHAPCPPPATPEVEAGWLGGAISIQPATWTDGQDRWTR